MTTPRRRQIYKPHRVGNDVSTRLVGDLSYGQSSSFDMLPLLAMMRLWLACTVENMAHRGVRYLKAVEAKALREAADIASGKTRAPALIPETARAPDAPKIMLNRRTQRIHARRLPASRQYGWFRYASPRALSGPQFFELVARLSVNGRMGVYKLEYKRRLCVQMRRRNCAFAALPVTRGSFSMGLSPNHLWPD